MTKKSSFDDLSRKQKDRAVRRALTKTKGNKTLTVKELGISLYRLNEHLREHPVAPTSRPTFTIALLAIRYVDGTMTHRDRKYIRDAIQEMEMGAVFVSDRGGPVIGYFEPWARGVALAALCALHTAASVRSSRGRLCAFVALVEVPVSETKGERLDEAGRDALRAAAAKGLDALTAPGVFAAPRAAELLRRGFSLEKATGGVFRVVGSREQRAAALHGRAADVTSLLRCIASAPNHQVTVLGVQGDPGIGKSALLAEVSNRLSAQFKQAHPQVFSAAAVPLGRGASYSPVAELLRGKMKVAHLDQRAVGRHAVEALVEQGLDPQTHLNMVIELLFDRTPRRNDAYSPELLKARRDQAICALLLSGERPTVYLVDDAHDLDAASHDVLKTLASQSTQHAVVLILSYRSTHDTPLFPHLHQVIELKNLEAKDSDAIVADIAGGSLSASERKALCERAGGNPLCLTSLTQLALQDPTRALPTDIKAVLEEQIASLDAAARRALQLCAVVGQNVQESLFHAAWPKVGDRSLSAQRAWNTLVLSPLLKRSNDHEYQFVHGLAREAVYAGIDRAILPRLHRTVARAITAACQRKTLKLSRELAEHWKHGNRPERACHHYIRATVREQQHWSESDARAMLDNAVEQAERCAPNATQDNLLVRAATAFAPVVLGRSPAEASQFLSRYRERADRPTTDPAIAGFFWFWLGHALDHCHDQAAAKLAYGKARERAAPIQDGRTLGAVGYAEAMAFHWASGFEEGLKSAQAAVTFLDKSPAREYVDRHLVGLASWMVAVNAIVLGRLDVAAEAAERTRLEGRITSDRRLLCFGAWSLGASRSVQSRHNEAVELCKEAVDFAPDPIASASAWGELGEAYWAMGPQKAGEARKCLEKAYRGFGEVGMLPLQAKYLARYAEATVAVSRDGARKHAEEARTLANRAPWDYAKGIALRALGQSVSNGKEAAGHLRDAESIFQSVGARTELERTLTLL